MSTHVRVPYRFTILHVVPHVHLGAFSNIGVVVYARTAEYLGMRAITESSVLHALAPDVDTELLIRYLQCYDGICRGDPAAGPLALLSRSERFHWIAAPRSDVLQPSPVHEGVCTQPAEEIEELFQKFVRLTAPRA
jgi:Protein of unknown function (DUF3037)